VESTAPNCFLSSVSPIASRIHLPTIDSKILLIAGVNDIGLRSWSTDFGGLAFGIGTTFALFHINCTIPSLIDELKLQARGSHKAKPSRAETNSAGRLVQALCGYQYVPACLKRLQQ